LVGVPIDFVGNAYVLGRRAYSFVRRSYWFCR